MENNEKKDYIPNQTIAKEELKSHFKNGDIPSQEDFWQWQDSYWHKNESLLVDGSNFGKVDKVMNIAPDANKNVDISGVNYTWTGQHRYSNVSDKKADLVYNRIGGFDNSGNMGIVGFPAIKNTFAGFSQAQALEIGQIINGGSGSEGAMSVNLISPPIIQKIDSDEYILLRGANLNLSATAKKIEIINATTKAVVATIPDNQIQLNSDGLSLIFYYNFKNFSYGNYLIRLTSGVKVYETTLELKCVQNVNNISLDNITWGIMYDFNVVPNTSTSAQGRNTTVVIPNIDSSTPKVSLKSSELFAQGQDFYIEFNLDVGVFSGNPASNSSNNTIGIGYSDTPISLAHNALMNITYRGSNITTLRAYLNGTVGIYGGSEVLPPSRFTIIIIKTGNLFRIQGPGGISIAETLSNNSGYAMFVSLVGRSAPQTIQTQITKAYTFN